MRSVPSFVLVFVALGCGASQEVKAPPAKAPKSTASSAPKAAPAPVKRNEPAPSDPAAAAAYFDKWCQAGDFEACTLLAHALMDARGVAEDMPRAITLFRNACAGGEPQACFAMGRVSGDGGIEALHDPPRAAQYYETACKKNVPDACAELAVVTATGRGVEKNEAAARALAEQACRQGSSVGCTAVGVLASKTATSSEDATVALQAFERACEIGTSQASDWACARAAYAYEKGLGVPSDEKKANELYERTCRAVIARRKSPDGDAMVGCVAVALVFDGGYPFLAEQNAEIARSLYTHACAKGSAVACAARGAHWERAGRKAEANADFKKACALGAKEACARVKR